MTFALVDESSVRARSEVLGASSVAVSSELPFLLATIEIRSVNFRKMLLLFHGTIAISLV